MIVKRLSGSGRFGLFNVVTDFVNFNIHYARGRSGEHVLSHYELVSGPMRDVNECYDVIVTAIVDFLDNES